MRNTLVLTIALAASYANAENQFGAAEEFQADQIRNLQSRGKRGSFRTFSQDLLGGPKKRWCITRVNSPNWIDSPCYFRSPFYQSQTAQAKIDQAWFKLVEEPEQERKEAGDDSKPEPLGIWWDKFDNFFTQKGNGSFCNENDKARENRPKIIHNQGVVAKVSWKPVDAAKNYSGIYATGSDNIIMRLSEAQNLIPESTGLTPAAAFKFYIDGIESQNILVQNSFMQSDSWNFFEKRLANRVEPFNETDHPIQFQTVHRKLTETNKMPYGTAIGHIGDKLEDGSQVDRANISIPYELRFYAPADQKAKFDFADNSENWYDRLTDRLKAGDTIYEVYGCTSLLDDNVEVKIAEVVLQTDLKISALADENLYFRHRQASRDFRYHPRDRANKAQRAKFASFRQKRISEEDMVVPEDVWPEDDDEAQDFYIDQVAETGCPFAWLLQ